MMSFLSPNQKEPKTLEIEAAIHMILTVLHSQVSHFELGSSATIIIIIL